MRANRWMGYVLGCVCLAGVAVVWGWASLRNDASRPDAIGLSVDGGRAQTITIDVDRWASFVSHTFVVRNQGGKTIVLSQEPQTSCGCANAELSTTRLQPGDQASLKLDIKLKPGYQSVTAMIPIEQPANASPLKVSLAISAPNTWQPTPTSQEQVAANGKATLRWRLIGDVPVDVSQMEIQVKIPGHSAKVVSVDFVDNGISVELDVTREEGSHNLTKGEVVFTDKVTGFTQSSNVVIRHHRRRVSK